MAIPMWGKPIIPKEMEADPQFNLDAVKESTRQLLRVSFIGTKVPAERFQPIIDALVVSEEQTDPTNNSVQVIVNKIGTLLDGLPEEVRNDPPLQPPCTQDDLDNDEPCTVYLKARTSVRTGFETINLMLDDDPDIRANLGGKLINLLQDRTATVGVTTRPACTVKELVPTSLPSTSDVSTCKDDRDKCALISALQQDLEKLANLLPTFGLSTEKLQSDILEIRASLKAQQNSLAPKLLAIDVHEAQEEADDVIRQIEPVLDAFQHKLNAFSISPVGVFDVARLWPDKNGSRYGIGGGLRGSIVNLNLTAGYAVNIKRQPGEGRGAFFFKMDVTDIFR
jgi:hypothetical protein